MSYCVLTGDLINSSKLSKRELDFAVETVRAAIVDISGWDGQTLAGFARRGGDAWQAVIGTARYDIRAPLFVAATLAAQGTQTRIAVACSDDKIDPSMITKPNDAYGDAFTASGRLVTDLPSAFPFGHAGHSERHAILVLAGQIAGGWTIAQSRAMALMLPPERKTQAEAATELGISRPAVQQALQAAGYNAIDRALLIVETDDEVS